jgi:hypothetical protein
MLKIAEHLIVALLFSDIIDVFSFKIFNPFSEKTYIFLISTEEKMKMFNSIY